MILGLTRLPFEDLQLARDPGMYMGLEEDVRGLPRGSPTP